MSKILVPQEWTEYSTTQQNELGLVVYDETTQKEYRYVKTHTALTNSTLAANEVVAFQDTAMNVVTNTLAATNFANVAGRATCAVPISTATVTYYCWVQVSGVGVLKTDTGDDIAAGDSLVPNLTTVQSSVDIMAAGEEHLVIASALAADVDAADTVIAMLKIH